MCLRTCFFMKQVYEFVALVSCDRKTNSIYVITDHKMEFIKHFTENKTYRIFRT